jgi:hypothetical protein
MVRYAAMVLWYPIKLVAILLFDEVPWCPLLQCSDVAGCWWDDVLHPCRGELFQQLMVCPWRDKVVRLPRKDDMFFHDAHLQKSWQQSTVPFPISCFVVCTGHLIYFECTGFITTTFVILVGQSEFHKTRTYWQHNLYLVNILLFQHLKKFWQLLGKVHDWSFNHFIQVYKNYWILFKIF